jgi:hypothetical protein
MQSLLSVLLALGFVLIAAVLIGGPRALILDIAGCFEGFVYTFLALLYKVVLELY